MYWIPFPGEPNDNSRRILMEAKLPKSCNLPSFDSFVTRQQHKPAGGSICVLAPPIFCHRSSSSPFTISKVMMLIIMMMVIRPAIFFFSLGHQGRVAGLGWLSAGAKMAMKPFVKRVFTIFATNASFLRVISNFRI